MKTAIIIKQSAPTAIPIMPPVESVGCVNITLVPTVTLVSTVVVFILIIDVNIDVVAVVVIVVDITAAVVPCGIKVETCRCAVNETEDVAAFEVVASDNGID